MSIVTLRNILCFASLRRPCKYIDICYDVKYAFISFYISIMFYSFNYYRCTICIYACVLSLHVHCTAFYSPATEALINNNNNNSGRSYCYVVWASVITCYSCGKVGHKSYDCRPGKTTKRWCANCKSATHDTAYCRRKKDSMNQMLDKLV